mmetsp:Transcript_21124/g.39647  ORF Transcript_21124/g.39647 Transcript_21124/m.39647 type:complete len:274 (+) Transcript_21124:1533-2354(+)
MPLCKRVMGKAGLGLLLSHSLNLGLIFPFNPSSQYASTAFSSWGIHDNIKWQFASSSQVPAFLQSCRAFMATGPWPWPKATWSTVCSSWSASCWTLAVGSTPGDRMKIKGVLLVLLLYISPKLKAGGSAYSGPMLLPTKMLAANKTLSGLKLLRTHICWSSLSLLSQSPGKVFFSGAALMYQLFQSLPACSMLETRPLKAPIFSSSQTLSQPASSIQVVLLPFWSLLSTTTPPKQKKSNSLCGILFSLCMILMHSCRLKSSLCLSNKPTQVVL